MGRGLSADEKRVKLVEIFHESKDFYQLKELEKLGPKLKGIVSQSVKDVLQSLVDDGLVEMDKIGSSNFYWSFPSAQGSSLTHKLETAKKEHQTLLAKQAELVQTIEMEKVDRIETPERRVALQHLSDRMVYLTTLKEELVRYGALDPEQVEEKKKGVLLAKEAAFRWTDNVAALLSHVINTFGIDGQEIRKEFGISDDFEDLGD